VAAAVTLAAPLASAEDTSTTSPAETTAKAWPPTSATPEMIAEAIARSKARTQRWLAEGVPEEFGSEEPFLGTTQQ